VYLELPLQHFTIIISTYQEVSQPRSLLRSLKASVLHFAVQQVTHTSRILSASIINRAINCP
jgi:hypothetical protein